MNKFEFYNAWWYLVNHKIFAGQFQTCLDIDVVKVNPETKIIDNDETKNIHTQIWVECGIYDERFKTHDIELDSGGDSFELAIIDLANKVRKKYN